MSQIIDVPSSEQIRKSALLRTIAHAIWAVDNPSLAYEYSWDGMSYVIHDSTEGYGAITFRKSEIVGVFFDVHSSRNPLLKDIQFNISTLFQGASETVLKLANEEALQYLLQEYRNLTQPIITAVFWTDNDKVVASEPWKDVVKHGAHLIEKDIFTDLQSILNKFQTDYELSDVQISLVKDLFNKKILQPQGELLLTKDQIRMLVAQEGEGEVEARELLNAIGIIWP